MCHYLDSSYNFKFNLFCFNSQNESNDYFFTLTIRGGGTPGGGIPGGGTFIAALGGGTAIGGGSLPKPKHK